mmetsp:Transcript_6978/g.18955  ORF Transcript_6978/g.18955 Transcript_6978/m.18955 type:complete len:200 (-) Transcript_6978:433-1032(-)
MLRFHPGVRITAALHAAARLLLVDVVLWGHDAVTDLLVQEEVRVSEAGGDDHAHNVGAEEIECEGDAVAHEGDQDERGVVLDGSEDAADVARRLHQEDGDEDADRGIAECLQACDRLVIVGVLRGLRGDALRGGDSEEAEQGDAEHDDVHDDGGATHIAASSAADVAALDAWGWDGVDGGLASGDLGGFVVVRHGGRLA